MYTKLAFCSHTVFWSFASKGRKQQMNPVSHSQKFRTLATCSGGAAGLEIVRNGPTSTKNHLIFFQKERSSLISIGFLFQRHVTF